MFIGLLSAYITGCFGRLLAFNFNGRIKCVYLNNGPCQARPTLAYINSSEPLYFPFNVSVNDYDGGCHTVDNPYARVCVPDKNKFECKSI